MQHDLSLTDEQKQRIANAKTDDEKARILAEEIGGTELTDEQLDAASGGVWRPSTKAEADEQLGFIRYMVSTFGPEVTSCYLGESGLPVISPTGLSNGEGIEELQRWWYHVVGATEGTYRGDASYFLSEY